MRRHAPRPSVRFGGRAAERPGEKPWHEKLSAYRDGALAFIPVCYIFGFFCWGLLSLRYGLGLLPVIDLQYFTAGAVPTVLVLVTTVFIWRFDEVRNIAESPIRAFEQDFQQLLDIKNNAMIFSKRIDTLILSSLSPFTLGLNVIQATYFLSKYFEKTDARTLNGFKKLAVFFVMSYCSVFLKKLLTNPSWSIPVSFYAFLFYTLAVFPVIPQSLGGGAIRYAQIDIAYKEFSIKPRIRLTGVCYPEDLPEKTTALTSLPLAVHYQGPNSLLVRVNGVVYELPRKHIRTVRWLD